MRLKNTANSTKLYPIQVHPNVFCKCKIHNSALSGIFVSVPCSCALKPINICAITLHIRQTLATFAVTHFPPQLPIWFKFVNIYFCKSVVKTVVSFPKLMCRALRYVTDQITKTAALLYLTLTSHSETQNKMALPESKFSIQFSKNKVYFCMRIWKQKAGNVI
jgi:hypothetical protein